MYNDPVTSGSQKSWSASQVGKLLASEATLCALQYADFYMLSR